MFYMFVFVCLFGYSLHHSKSDERILMKFSGGMGRDPNSSRLNFCGYLGRDPYPGFLDSDHDPVPRIFYRIL